MWHWERILDGPYKGGWIHPYFTRGNKLLCTYMSRHGIPKLNVIQQVLMSSPEMSKNSLITQQLPSTMTMINQNRDYSDKLDFSFTRTTTSGTNPLKMISESIKNIEEDWEPLPASFNDEESTSFDGPTIHFSEHIQGAQFLDLKTLEPTPIREDSTFNELLKPISAETIDFLF